MCASIAYGIVADQEGAEILNAAGQILAPGFIDLALPAGVPECLSPLPAIGVGQLFAMELAIARDLNPSHPRALHKVTETR